MNFRSTIAHGRKFDIKLRPLSRTRGELLADWERLVQARDFALRARDDVRDGALARGKARLEGVTVYFLVVSTGQPWTKNFRSIVCSEFYECRNLNSAERPFSAADCRPS